VVVVIKVGLIGAGMIARKGHLPALKRMSGVEVVAVVDVNEKVAERVAREFSISKYYTDLDEMLKGEDVDALIVCTPTPTHYDIVMKCVNEGRSVLVEKPLCIKYEEALDIAKAAEEQGVQVCVVYNYRYFPAVVRAYRRVIKGYLGRVLTLNGTIFSHFPVAWTRATWLYHEGGVLYDFLPHMVDMIVWFSGGKPCKVVSFGGDYLPSGGFTNHAQIMVEFDNGVLSSISTSWLMGTQIFNLNVHGTAGHIFLDVRYNFMKEIHGTPTPLDDAISFAQYMVNVVKGVLSGYLFVGALAHYPIILRKFMLSLRRKGRYPVTAREELDRVFILDAALTSIKSGGRMISREEYERH